MQRSGLGNPLLQERREAPIEVHCAIVEGPAQGDCIRVNRRDDVGARRQFLGRKKRDETEHQQDKKFRSRNRTRVPQSSSAPQSRN